MSGRQEKLRALMADFGERRPGDAQFGEYLACRSISDASRRRLGRLMMRAKRQIWRKHGVRVSAWKWVESAGSPDSPDPMGWRCCLAVKMYGGKGG